MRVSRKRERVKEREDAKHQVLVWLSGSVCLLIGLQPAGGTWS